MHLTQGNATLSRLIGPERRDDPRPIPIARYLLAIQRQAGNAAAATLVARQAVIAPPSTEALTRAIERELTRAPGLKDDSELGEALAAAALNAVGRGLDDTQRKAVERRVFEMLSVHRQVADTTYGVHSALKGLNDIQQAGNQEADAPDVQVSYGLRLVTSMLAGHAAEHIIAAITPSILQGDTLAFIDDDLAVAVTALTDASSLLDLELEGTLARLADVRAEFKTAPAGADRAALGAEIGRLARRALLLDRQLTATGKTNALDHHITKIGPRIAAIRSQAQTEDESMKAMDADLGLLGQTVTPVRSAEYSLTLDSSIQPEEAFPKATDAASNEFMDELADQLSDQAKQLADLRGKVIPKNPTYRLDELSQVHARWFAFFSAEQEKRDMALMTAWNLLDQGWGILGNAALPPQVQMSAAIIRAQMLSQFSGFIGGMMGEASQKFAGELASPKRAEPDVTGSARYPDYQFAEVLPQVSRNRQGNLVKQTRNVQPSAKGEAASRSDYITEEKGRTAREFSQVAQHKTPAKEAVSVGLAPDEKPIIGLRSPSAQEGWSYLIDVVDLAGTGAVVAREHKVMPTEVADYLVAAHQHSATRAGSHQPKAAGRALGEAAIRQGGVEAGEGTAAARYLEGADKPAMSSAATRLRGQMTEADQRIGAGKGKGPTQLLIEDLESYVSEFFVQNQSKGMRIAAIFLIAQREHNVGAQLFGLLTPEVLQELIFQAVKVSTIMAILQRLGPIGNLVAFAYQIYLKSQGVSNVAALVGIATFLWEASSTDNFRQARAFALLSQKIVGDAAELLEDLLTKPIEIGLGKLTEKPPNGSREFADALGPIMKDEAARKAVIDGTNQKIAELEAAGKLTGRSDPELEAWRAFRNQIDGVDRFGDPPPFAEVVLPGKTTAAGKTTLDTAFAPAGRTARSKEALREGLGDLAGKVAIVENNDPSLGATVRVHYDGGKVRMVVGPDAGKREIQQHYETAKILHRYEAPLGKVLKLIERATAWLTGQKAIHGTQAFESKLEVRKLRQMIDELNGEKAAIEARAARIQGDPAARAVEIKDLDARITDLEAQLKYHETQLGNVEAGRGWVAAEDNRRPKQNFPTRDYRPSKIVKLTNETLLKRVGPDPARPNDPAAHAELRSRYEQQFGAMTTAQLVGESRRRGGRSAWYIGDMIVRQFDAGTRRRGNVTEYLARAVTIEDLRVAARWDTNAAEALVRRYNRDFSEQQLQNMAAKGDGTAQWLLGQVPGRTSPVDPKPSGGPRMSAAAEARLIEGVWERRRTAIEQAERAEQQARASGNDQAIADARRAAEAAQFAGTLGAMETDIAGISKQIVRGSPEAPAPPTPKGQAPRTYQPPGNQPPQAQFHAEEQLLNDLAHAIRQRRLKPKDLDGKTVRIAVDQEVCSVCAAGVGGGQAQLGVILQFSQRYPGLKIEIVDIRTGHYDVFQGGTRTVTYPGLGPPP